MQLAKQERIKQEQQLTHSERKVVPSAMLGRLPASGEKSEDRRAPPRAPSEAGAARGGLPRRDRHRLERVAASHDPMDALAARRPAAARESLCACYELWPAAGGVRAGGRLAG